VIARALRQLAVLLAIAIVPALVSGVLRRGEKQEILQPDEVLAATARGWGDKVQWVDARTRKRFEQEHIPGAILLNEDEWGKLIASFLNEWDPDKTIVVYCDGGGCEASKAVAERLRTDLKLENRIFVLKGGWSAWKHE
jgi:rhodanese-related sulfurtransferase